MFSHEPCVGVKNVLKPVRVRGQKGLRLFGNVRRVIIEYDSDVAFRRIPRVEVRQQAK